MRKYLNQSEESMKDTKKFFNEELEKEKGWEFLRADYPLAKDLSCILAEQQAEGSSFTFKVYE